MPEENKTEKGEPKIRPIRGWGSPLASIAVALMCRAGIVGLDEARSMLSLPALTDEQRLARRNLLAWCKQTGMLLPLSYWEV